MNIGKYIILWVLVMMVVVSMTPGCASVISERALKNVDHSIRLAEILKNPDAYKGKTVLLGGNIIETQNLSERTLIMVLHFPIGFRKKPNVKRESKGRFINSIPGFLDPAIYRPGRKITVVGPVVGKEKRPLGEIEYSYPIIVGKELYIWPPESSLSKKPSVHFGFGVGVGL